MGADVGCDIVWRNCASVDGAWSGDDGVSFFPEYSFLDSSGLESAGVRNANASGLCQVFRARTAAYLRIRTRVALAAAVVLRISERERRILDSTFFCAGGEFGGDSSTSTPQTGNGSPQGVASLGLRWGCYFLCCLLGRHSVWSTHGFLRRGR